MDVIETIKTNGCFLQVELSGDHNTKKASNSNLYTIKITTDGGQNAEINGTKTDNICFSIVGDLEFYDFMKSINLISKKLNLNFEE